MSDQKTYRIQRVRQERERHAAAQMHEREAWDELQEQIRAAFYGGWADSEELADATGLPSIQIRWIIEKRPRPITADRMAELEQSAGFEERDR